MRRRGPRLPWKRGPAAWRIAGRADQIGETLAGSARRFFSLRAAARALGSSTQPLRDWVKWGYLRRDGPRLRFSREELARFTKWLEERAEPYDPENYHERFPATYPFKQLADARFAWPKGKGGLKPSELAALAGCHPSLIVKAIHGGRLPPRRRTKCRWEVSKHAWRYAFPATVRPP